MKQRTRDGRFQELFSELKGLTPLVCGRTSDAWYRTVGKEWTKPSSLLAAVAFPSCQAVLPASRGGGTAHARRHEAVEPARRGHQGTLRGATGRPAVTRSLFPRTAAAGGMETAVWGPAGGPRGGLGLSVRQDDLGPSLLGVCVPHDR